MDDRSVLTGRLSTQEAAQSHCCNSRKDRASEGEDRKAIATGNFTSMSLRCCRKIFQRDMIVLVWAISGETVGSERCIIIIIINMETLVEGILVFQDGEAGILIKWNSISAVVVMETDVVIILIVNVYGINVFLVVGNSSELGRPVGRSTIKIRERNITFIIIIGRDVWCGRVGGFGFLLLLVRLVGER